ncbi:MAG: trypsin-like peptidase domain-containing protein [Firmicutes bacterium]|nr:trypsin-like peptidase domain-containing protein [Bacillota bacterium]
MSTHSSFQNLRFWVYVVISLVLLAIGAVFFRFFTQGGNVSPPNLNFNTVQVGLEERGREGVFDATKVVEKVGPAVAQINTRTELVLYDYFRRPYLSESEGLGSGVVIEENGYILTNNHVVAGATTIEVTLPGREPVEARLVGADPQTDLAVIKISDSDLPVAELGDSTKLKVGESVVAIGNPFGFDNTVTTGVISALGRSLAVGQNVWLEGLIQTDASINPGNSGGPLLNAEGQVIGINTAIIEQAQGIGFSIPIHMAVEVVRDLVKYGKVLRLGVYAETLTRETASRIERAVGLEIPVTTGVIVLGVKEGSPAARAGLRAGDVIFEFNGKKVESRDQLLKITSELDYRDPIQITAFRGRRRLRLTTRLE